MSFVEKIKSVTVAQWIAIALFVAVIITAIVLHFVQPQVSYAFFEIGALALYLLGLISGYLIKKNNIIKNP